MSLPSYAESLAQALEMLRQAPVEPANQVRRAAVAILISLCPPEPCVLLMRRAERAGDRWSGQIALPGGHEDSADVNLLDTAVRETREELGVDLHSQANFRAALPPVQARARSILLPLWIHPQVFTCDQLLETVLSGEASEAFWLPLASAHCGCFDAEYRYDEGGVARILPSWSYQGRVVWGLTYRMLQALLQAWRPAPPQREEPGA